MRELELPTSTEWQVKTCQQSHTNVHLVAHTPVFPTVQACLRVSHSLLCMVMPKQHTHTHTYPFNGPLSGTIQGSRYQKGKTNLDFTEARSSEWQWHQLGHMQVCTSLQTDNHASTPPLSFLQAGCPSCCLTNSIKALKAK